MKRDTEMRKNERRMMRLLLVSALCFSSLLSANPVKAQHSEEDVKAAFLFNFARFTKWPDEVFTETQPVLRFCVMDSGKITSSLQRDLPPIVSGKRTLVRSLESGGIADDCHLLYIGKKRIADQLLKAETARKPILIVGDEGTGGMIEFVKKGDRLAFSLNLSRIQAVKIFLSSHLLKLAVSVTGGT
jgi:hypothetical protein